MYTPIYHREDDPAQVLAFVREHPFAALVSIGPDGAPLASHLPFVVQIEPAEGENESPGGGAVHLMAHLARANLQWEYFGTGNEAMVIFGGPHAYISPSLYERTENVPTWNYVAVHAYGIPVILNETVQKRRVLDLLIAQEEPEFAARLAEFPEAKVEGLLRSIVAFEIRVTRFEARYKLSQERSVNDRRTIVDTLAESEHAADRATAAMMEAREPG